MRALSCSVYVLDVGRNPTQCSILGCTLVTIVDERNADTAADEYQAMPDYDELTLAARSVLEAAWQPSGYSSPNRSVYPWMWLWDSCFHAIVWAALGDERALVELESVFTWQTTDGFVPHIGYQIDPTGARPLWGRDGHSSITQPPMYCHAARVLADAGYEVPDRIMDSIERGLSFFWRHRMADDGLVRIVHPWESGADDSPRWDSFAAAPFARPEFNVRKKEMITALDLLESGSSVGSSDFSVGSVAFNALLAFNAYEFAALSGSTEWRDRADKLSTMLDRRWDDRRVTWVDTGPHASAGAPTSDALLGLLVVPERFDTVWQTLTDPVSFGAPCGPRNVDRRYPGYNGAGYWRGATWPQINYLLWLAVANHRAAAHQIASQTVSAAWASGFSEYWHPDSGAGYGAAPQSWTTLAVVMHPERSD